ncbi:hypothetical protein BGZ83_001234 [Gryganskiella cystojenkinii]|nr:hypothetical protein BGZ83_001234 [Gryganskiella cystojenkinii]
MTPAPSSSNRNRRSATLANIPPPQGPPPAIPPGHPNTPHIGGGYHNLQGLGHNTLNPTQSLNYGYQQQLPLQQQQQQLYSNPLLYQPQQSAHSSFSSQSGQQQMNINAPGHLVYAGVGAGLPPGPTLSNAFAPPRASFSSSRASPVGDQLPPQSQQPPPQQQQTSRSSRSGKERDQEQAWNDSAWRGIFDAALVKAQQAVQLDELQETAMAANLYAQAANDLGRVIPMCSSEKKKQSMVAIQAIYLDRVTQLREAAAKNSSGAPKSVPAPAPAQQQQQLQQPLHPMTTIEGSYSVASSRGLGGYAVASEDQFMFQQQQQHQFQQHPQIHQQYQPQTMYQNPAMLQQQQRFNQQMPPQLQQYQQQQQQQALQNLPPSSPMMQSPFMQQQSLMQPMQTLQQHQLQHQSSQNELQLQQQQQQYQQQEPEKQEKPEKSSKSGFGFFGKKRSKTQPSATQPPDFGQSPQMQNSFIPMPNGLSGNNNNTNLNNHDGFIPYNDNGVQDRSSNNNLNHAYNQSTVSSSKSNSTNNANNSNNNTQGYDSLPYVMPPATPTPPPQVSAIFMTHAPTPPTSSSNSQSAAATATAEQDQQALQSSKSSKWPFGKKKSKSFSASTEVTIPPRTTSAPEPDQEQIVPAFQQQAYDVQVAHTPTPPLPQHPQQFPQMQPQQQQQQQQQHLVHPQDHIDAYSQQNQADWYVATPEEDEDDLYDDFNQNPDLYFEDEDEDVDPYYIADTKGRAKAFEGKDDKDMKGKETKAETETQSSRRPLKQNSSSYSQESNFSPKFAYAQMNGIEAIAVTDTVVDQEDAQTVPHQKEAYQDKQEYEEEVDQYHYAHNNLATDDSDMMIPYDQQIDAQYQQYQQDPTAYLQQNVHHPIQETHSTHTHTRNGSSVSGSVPAAATASAVPEMPQAEAGDGLAAVPVQELAAGEKTKTKRTWYGKKKKDKAEKVKEPDHLDEVARLMDDAMFGGSSIRSSSKDKTKSSSKEQIVQPTPALAPAPILSPIPPAASFPPALPPASLPMIQADEDELMAYGDRTEIPLRKIHTMDSSSRSVDAEFAAAVAQAEAEAAAATAAGYEGADNTDQPMLLPETSESVTNESGFSLRGQDSKSINSDTAKKSSKPSRHFSIFKKKSKDNTEDTKDFMKDGSELTTTVTNEGDAKSLHSQHTRRSSMQSDRKITQEKELMAVALSVRAKEVQKQTSAKYKRDSDEYVPYEYQEELEGPLMERVEVPENREVIGFVLPVEEVIDYTAEDNEEAALENWDSWVSQLESFEKVLSDKGMKKDKKSKLKKAKEVVKPAKDDLASVKANNRSSIFNLGRSDTAAKSRTTLDLTTTAMLESRPLSLSTTLLDDASVAPRPSFQSSQSGGSEAPSQFMMVPPPKKRSWWKRKDNASTNSIYRVSNAFSMADLEQDQHLSSLLQQQDQVKSAEDLSLNTMTLTSMPLVLNEPTTPAPSVLLLSKEAPAAMESVPVAATALTSSKTATITAEEEVKPNQEEAEEEEAQEPEAEIAPMPKKPKSKSNKPKLLPISTPLADLLKIQNAEELWLYVQQAKTYATSRMNKGDKRSAAIALKRGQALEARWQEILLEMASSGEDTDELLEESEEDSDEQESAEEEAPVPMPVPVKKEKRAKTSVAVVEPEPEPEKDVQVESLVVKSATAAVVAVEPVAPAPKKVVQPEAAVVTPIIVVASQEEDDEEEEPSYAAQRRKNKVSRSSTTPDKYSKYKNNNRSASSTPLTTARTSDAVEDDLTVAAEDKSMTTTSSSSSLISTAIWLHDDGRLGPDATMDEMLATTRIDHMKFYIQRMKTDTVAKARNGSKFAALEGMKNVKVLQQRLEDLQNPSFSAPEAVEAAAESVAKEEEKTEKEPKDEDEEEEPQTVKVPELAPVVEEEEEEEEEEKEVPVKKTAELAPVVEEQQPSNPDQEQEVEDDDEKEDEWEESKGDSSPQYTTPAAVEAEDKEQEENEDDEVQNLKKVENDSDKN